MGPTQSLFYSVSPEVQNHSLTPHSGEGESCTPYLPFLQLYLDVLTAFKAKTKLGLHLNLVLAYNCSTEQKFHMHHHASSKIIFTGGSPYPLIPSPMRGHFLLNQLNVPGGKGLKQS